ncbi:hypothetical protein HPP92_004314 [Vanilla planifolia]|uniref:Uncharacterized protein n=1 Tax=Vanilla planifolia TaxID=51239 RepID=A0A835S968_VANPL|nr:hypothetical protein HPP92_004314 [Vanilla planifolia]
MEDVRNNSSMKCSIRRQCSSLSPATITRTVKDISRPAAVVEQINGGPDNVIMNSKPSETNLGGGGLGQSREHKSESYGDAIVGSQTCSGKINGNNFHQEMHSLLVPRKSQLKRSSSYNQLEDLTFSPHRRTESQQCTTNAIVVNKRPPSSKKQSLNSHKTRMHLWKGFFKRC